MIMEINLPERVFHLEVKVERLAMEDCWAWLESFTDLELAKQEWHLISTRHPENHYRIVEVLIKS